jgi:hypothetical protein
MLRLIATFVLIYLLFRVLTAWVFPLVVRWWVNRYKKKYYRDNARTARQDQQPESKTDRIGEYVDFEEIKHEKDPKNDG